MKKIITMMLVLISLASFSQTDYALNRNSLAGNFYSCQGSCLSQCSQVEVNIEFFEYKDSLFVEIEDINFANNYKLFKIKKGKSDLKGEKFHLKPYKNKWNVKKIYIQDEVIFKHKHNLFKKCYIVYHNGN